MPHSPTTDMMSNTSFASRTSASSSSSYSNFFSDTDSEMSHSFAFDEELSMSMLHSTSRKHLHRHGNHSLSHSNSIESALSSSMRRRDGEEKGVRDGIIHFSLSTDLRSYLTHIVHLLHRIDDGRLPWSTDFMDPTKMKIPRKSKDVMGRINLNIPYYFSNYLQVFYAVTLPYLLLFNLPFLVVVLVCCVLAHSVAEKRRHCDKHNEPHSICFFGLLTMSFRMLTHLFVVLCCIMILFFHLLTTIAIIVLLNALLIIPHALLRRPTNFDDEDLEKCRPKLSKCVGVAIILLLVYLEGPPAENEAAHNLLAARRERERLGIVEEVAAPPRPAQRTESGSVMDAHRVIVAK